MRQEWVPRRKTSPERLSIGEILIEGPDGLALRFDDDRIVRVFRNRSAGSNGGKPCAAPAFHASVDLIAMEHCTATPAGGCDALGEHGDHGIEIFARQCPIRVGAADHCIQAVLTPAFHGGRGDNLLGEDVERIFRDLATAPGRLFE